MDLEQPSANVVVAHNLIRGAEEARDSGDLGSAITMYQRAVSLLAALHEGEFQDDESRASVCRMLGDALVESGRIPEAMQAYQEALDACGRLPDGGADSAALAQIILDGVRSLWSHPQDRLLLLVARLEREQRQIAECSDSFMEQAECAFRIATILHRRDRFEDAAKRYLEAVRLFEPAPESEMRRALCHQRIAGLYQHELADPEFAAHHYDAAIRLYREHEPMSEGHQMDRELCEELRGSLEGLARP